MPLEDGYVLVTARGEGYFAIVIQYKSKRTGKMVAVKRLKKASLSNPDHVLRFQKEISFLKKLQGHKNIVTLITSGTDERGPYYIMPYALANLHEYIKHHNNTLIVADRIALFDQILSGLLHAHKHDILHRDLSATNALIFPSLEPPTVALADFGLGKDAKSMSAYTASSVSHYGQPFYVSPEQRDHLKDATDKSDIYSLGKLLNFVMTGKDPDVYHTCDFGSVIRKATNHDPDKRHNSIEAFSDDYEKIKLLVLATDDDIEARTLKSLRDKTKIDWHKFHKLALEARVIDHVYTDFLDPVVHLLSDAETVKVYHSIIGTDISSFVSMLIAQMNACFRTIGWPFRATHSFGHLLNRLFLNIDDTEVKVLWFTSLWDIGFGNNEWDVQEHVKDIFRNELLPTEAVAEVAAHIINSGLVVEESQLGRGRIPTPIRKALETVAREAEKRKANEA